MPVLFLDCFSWGFASVGIVPEDGRLVTFGLWVGCYFFVLVMESLILAQDERWRRA